MQFGQEYFAKLLIAIGITITLVGVAVLLLGKMGLFNLTGDLQFGSKNWRLFLPITSCVIISIVLTLILWLISY